MSTTIHTDIDPRAVERFTEMIQDIKFAMLATVASDGAIRSRPMATLESKFDGDLWFFTEDDSPKIDEIVQEHHVCLSYAEPAKQKYVSVSGLASVVRDRDRARELWTPAAKAWFPRGVDDPHLALLRVRVQNVEYWDSPSSKMVQLFGFAKAVVTGKRLENAGEHKKIEVAPASERMEGPH
jgi:general stress protein 26